MKKRGIDISHHQGDIDFSKLKGNIDFAMIRASYGNFHVDRNFKKNILGLEKIGVPYGLYHYSYAKSKEEAQKEAEQFIELIKSYNPLYPVAFDIENNSKNKSLSKDVLVNITDTFCKYVESKGYYVVIYSNLNFFNTKLNSIVLDVYDKWVAQWGNKLTYEGVAGMWQYSSNGSINGINGNVDLDIAFKNYPSIISKMNKKDTIYKVKKGDTLIGIAKKYKSNYKTLAAYNHISNPNKIYAGQIIKIP